MEKKASEFILFTLLVWVIKSRKLTGAKSAGHTKKTRNK
jgi:hypothetical protein